MLAIADQTAKPNCLTFFNGTNGYLGVTKTKKLIFTFKNHFLKFYWQRCEIQLVHNKTE